MTIHAGDAGGAEAPSSYRRRASCRGCGGTELECVLELGPQPLANALPKSPAEFADEARFPLDLFVCRRCFLVQLLDVVDPEVLFRDYVYLSGTSRTMAEHFASYARHVMDLAKLHSEDLVVEIASNDGTLLQHFHRAGVRVLGIEPAANVAELSRASGLETLAEFFDRGCATKVREQFGPAKVVMANNVFAHVDDPLGFLEGCRTLMGEGGMLVIEVPYLRNMLDDLEYDTIYHEHLSYFCATPLLPLFARGGLSVVRIDHHPVHGGSLRFHAVRSDLQAEHAPAALSIAEHEARAGLADMEIFRRFGNDVRRCREQLQALLATYRAAGRSMAAYGAPAKGNTLLNYCGVGPETLTYIVDRNPLKVGRYTPGTHIEVCDVGRLETEPPDALLILAWNYADEVFEQLSWLRERGTDFIVPVPHPRVM
jgi:SAM-dependent methyltransferase